MKTGLPRHLMMTYRSSCQQIVVAESLRTQVTHVLALRDGIEVNLNLGHGQDISGGRHVDKELYIIRISKLHSINDRPLCIHIWPCRKSIDSASQPKEANGVDEEAEPTLNGALGASRGDGAHGTDHEVLEELVGARVVGRDVLSKVRDVAGLLAALEGAAVRGPCRAVTGRADRGRAQGAHASRSRGGGAKARAGSVGDSRHRCSSSSSAVRRGGAVGWLRGRCRL